MATSADAAGIAAVYGHYVRDTVVSFEIEPPDEAEMEGRIARTLARWPWLVATDADRVVGYAYAGEHHARAAYRFAVDVSVYLGPEARGQGLGRRLYGVLLGVVRRQGFVTAWAGITLPNPASVGLHEAFGFRPVGVYRNVGFKQGAWWDVGWWSLPLREPPAAPEEPIALPELREPLP